MPWQPGESGNPAGRPARGTSFAEVLRKVLAEEVMGADGQRITRMERICDAVCKAAETGDVAAFAKIKDHVDGCPARQVTVISGNAADAPKAIVTPLPVVLPGPAAG